ncbi:MAG: AAA family ATPase [Ruminococcus sp.]|nr:AAA family ATPase [Ruminococcus sp.]
MDVIFICGASGVGKSTLAKGLCRRLGGVLIEQNMVPEFSIPEGCPDEGAFEERVCWGNMLVQIEYFLNSRFRNIIALDFDDIRTCEIPAIFGGREHIILRLYSGRPEQLLAQLEKRREQGEGLFDPAQSLQWNEAIGRRPLLPNEVKIDVAGKTPEEVLEEALGLIESAEPRPVTDYFPDNRGYMSWVKSRQGKL